MKTFIIASFAAVGLLAAATYKPVRVCESNPRTEVSCAGSYCVATTTNTQTICHWSQM